MNVTLSTREPAGIGVLNHGTRPQRPLLRRLSRNRQNASRQFNLY